MGNQSSFGDFKFKPLTDEEKVAMKKKRIIQDEWMKMEVWLKEVKERSKRLEVWLDKGMSIDRQKTFDEKGYWVEDLSPGSHEKVWAVCIQCGKGRWTIYKQHRNLCKSCVMSGERCSEELRKKRSDIQSGENNSMFGKHHSEESLQKMSVVKIGKHPSEETRKKMSDARSGENHPMFGKSPSEETRIKSSCTHRGIPVEEFPGFKTQEHVLFRNSREYDEWRTAVFERDNYTCQECGAHGVEFQAHHINPLRLYREPEYSLNVDNGITLCKLCHDKTKGHEDEFYNKYTAIVKANCGFKDDFLSSSVILEGLKKQNDPTCQSTLF